LKKVGAEKKKQIRKEERDISEKIALGQAQPTNQDIAYDQRLFDNAGGIEAGNSDSEDDNLYDKPLFADRSAVNAQTANAGTRDRATRTAPVQFEMHKESIFGMNDLLNKPSKKVKKDE
jgi:SNW domain-containing protein 1